jgi:MoaA/NifB/PqqE/SkfB family radical SAM enzyme
MSYLRKKGFCEKLGTTRSLRGFAQHFLLGNMAGQKLFLYNPRLPRVINISFHEKTCMLSCKMCPYVEEAVRDRYREGSFMEFRTLQKIVASVPNDSYHSFDMSDIGETLAFEPLEEFIRYMKDQRPRVNTIVSTNGLLLTEERFLRLAKSGLDSIQVSLFAENAEDYFRITGARAFDRVKSNLEAVGKVKRRKGLRRPFVQTFMIECQENRHTSRRFVEYWSRHVDHAFVRPMYNVGRHIEGMTATIVSPPVAGRYPCITPWYSTAIRSTGDVLPCYMFHWHTKTGLDSLANINELSLAEIWGLPEFKHFREKHLRLEFEELPVCAICNLWAGYTNIWRRNQGRFEYAPLAVRDLLSPAPISRGG